MKLILYIVLLISLFSCTNNAETVVVIETEYGTMKARLYNETPLHRDNFIKLVSESFFDSLIFHRVIQDFMIQGGDPDSKNADSLKILGNGGPSYDIPAEFVSKYHHKKGVIAAAREGDGVNPLKKSSGSQFYIVQGKKFKKEEIERIAISRDKRLKFTEYLNSDKNSKIKQDYMNLQKQGNKDEFIKYANKIREDAVKSYGSKKLFSYTEEQISDYVTIGGTPHLDGEYTVFGEVFVGLDVIDKIASIETSMRDRPTKDVRMIIKIEH